MTNTKNLSSVLDSFLLQDFIFIREYQDKYFFVKKIEEFFPSIKEEIIYTALDKTNNFFNKPIKKKLFIDKFTSEINNMIS
ncbi:MAG: hypothetical protein R6W90_15615 [Ignavibacteriaceae bacterium]